MAQLQRSKIGEDALPKELSERFSTDEKILFNYKQIALGNTAKYGKYFFISIFMIIIVVILIITLQKGHLIEMILSPIYLVVWVLLAFIGVVMFIFLKLIGFKVKFGFIFTNRGFYSYTTIWNRARIISCLFPRLRAVIFKKTRLFDRKAGVGTIEFVSDDFPFKRYWISKVSNFQKVQQIIESILYEYGEIKQQWESIQRKTNLRFPYTLHLSQGEVDWITNAIKRMNLYRILTVFITLVSGLIIYILFLTGGEKWDQSTRAIILITYFTLVLILPVSLILGVTIAKYFLKRDSARENATLTLHSHQVILSGGLSIISSEEITPITIALNSEIVVNYSMIQLKNKYVVNWDSDKFGIIIKPSFDSPLQIRFGPFDDFPTIFEIFFCYFIIWKAEHGLLIPKEELLMLNSIKSE